MATSRLPVEPIASWRLGSYCWWRAVQLRRAFDARQVDCVFDVGAFDGHHGRFLRDEVQYDGLMISFEGQPRLFARLAE